MRRAAGFATEPIAAQILEFRLGTPPGRTRSPSKESSLTQSELELENVRVVRNDLSDADLRIVAGTRPAAARSAMKPKRTETGPTPVSDSRFVWNRLTARLFVAGRSRLE